MKKIRKFKKSCKNLKSYMKMDKKIYDDIEIKKYKCHENKRYRY